MVKFVVSKDNAVVEELSFDDNETIVIGRHPEADISLAHPAISSIHAEVTFNFAHFIEDKGSTNGTFVKGRRFHRSILMNGDEIQIGPFTLLYKTEAKPKKKKLSADASLNNAEKTMIFSNVNVAKPPEAGIVTLTGGNPGKVIDLNDPFVTLGRAGKHAALVMRKPAGFQISHIRSSSPEPGEMPTVNGELLDEAGRMLASRDVISVDGMTMRYFDDMSKADAGLR